MPEIRDYTWAYETVTTDAGLTIPVPNNSAGDLLLALIMSDTGTPVWTHPSGWTALFSRTNTCHLMCAYKISNGSEPASLTWTSTVNETYNGSIISIRDVDQSNPFGSPAVYNNTTQAAAAKFSMQTINTNRDNALCIVAAAISTATVPSFIEGNAHSLVANDGAAESLGIGWMFQAKSGSTSAVSCSNIGSSAGVKAVIQIAPPTSSIQVIPTYVSEDLSRYLNPIHGITSYNSDTGLASTADTNFGTTLGGITAADATVAAVTDAGINSFHSVGQLTTTANATTIYGAELVFATANRPNISGKNILVHVQPSTAGQLQRLTNIASGKGIWFGVRSAASNYKIWQVLGSDSPGIPNFAKPVIINDQALNIKANAGTLDPTSCEAVGFWIGGTAAGTVAMQFASLWLLDKITLCGGNSNFPIEISKTVTAIADSHERKSAILQGSKQMILLQDLQIGNGGIDQTYLNYDGTAIEFPSQYNVSTKLVSYNSIDNKIGLTYYPGVGDTIIHKNSLVSSPNQYMWGIHPSASSAATYNFSGLTVLGAGNISLNNSITGSGFILNQYGSISCNNFYFDNCIFKNVPTSSNSILINNSTAFNSCEIDVSLVSASNYWCNTSTPEKFKNCSFIGGGGHALRITGSSTTSSIDFVGNTFTGFGSNETNVAAILNAVPYLILNISNGTTPTYKNNVGCTTIIVNTVTVTFTGLKDNTEVRIFNAGTTNEIAGIETATDGTADNRSFAFSATAATLTDIVIINLLYQNIRIENYQIPESSTSIPIQQTIDRYYLNP